MDTINIYDLEVFAYHGVMKEENVVGQKFSISASLYTDIKVAANEDSIEHSVNYAAVCTDIKEFVERNTFCLIESVAQNCADLLLLKYASIQRVILEVKKPWAPIHLPVETVSVRIERGWHTAYLSLGSNIGDKKSHLEKAIEALKSRAEIRNVIISDFIVTAPVGYTDQDDFLNAALKIQTLLDPYQLLEFIHEIEQVGGRERKVHWGPRTIDLDIILFDDYIIGDEKLVIPHPEAIRREFVLRPLCQIAPYAIHPILKKTCKQLLADYNEREQSIYCEMDSFGFEGIAQLEVKEETKVVYFGVEGTYSQVAMERYFGIEGYQSYSRPKFTEVMAAVANSEADYGVIPIENSSTGGITDIYDHMNEYDITIVGEQIIKIEHALLALPGSDVSNLTKVYSHIQGIRQCEGFFAANPHITPVELSSTAEGARLVLEHGDKTQAAIASRRAAKVYELDTIKTCLNDQNCNSTRFVILSNKKQYIKNADKISISFETKHESGALYRILSHFYKNGINLEKIESRPIPHKTWEYSFFVDIAGNLDMQGVKNALSSISKEADNVRILGNY